MESPEDVARDLMRRARDAARRAAETRAEVAQARAARGALFTKDFVVERLTPQQDCARVHGLLRSILEQLDTGFRAPEYRQIRARLIDGATIACANARLQRHADMRADLQGLLSQALSIPLDKGTAEDERAIVKLRRLVRAALTGQPGEEDQH